MVEHTGAQSAIQGPGNARFHTTANFPYEVAFPMMRNINKSGVPHPPQPSTRLGRSTASQAVQQDRGRKIKLLRLY